MPEKIIFITGGARSGKSRLAEKLAESNGGQVAYIATAGVLDAEMAERVKIHQERRPAGWLTIEEPLSLTGALTRVPATVGFVIVDCLTLWLTNRLLQEWETVDMAVLEKEILLELALFMDQLPSTPFRIAIVTNEVGCGIVPESALARAFRDLAGRANQMVAARADTVYLTVTGLPLKLKGGA
ncbi:MAG: bifunctional adenosylcobinamide kinase/adenosylcobinamide-phosphate guanylyltransferase [Dethiobacter sp.]|nr:bifunctional adenosylcobinamide kinase/adenosylcobinamide-phosphate guanylyltransferase [Dethiobacter sp.]